MSVHNTFREEILALGRNKYGFSLTQTMEAVTGAFNIETQRDRYAAMAMQGILAGNVEINDKLSISPEWTADYAVQCANELVRHLNPKEVKNENSSRNKKSVQSDREADTGSDIEQKPA